MTYDNGNHPDDGTIHAWLDGALDADEAARISAHVSTCGACAELVAEARGLIAGASRVISQLDDAPAPHMRATVSDEVTRASLWRTMRVTPARASIAAVLVITVGVVMTQRSATKNLSPAPQTSAVADSHPTVSAAPASPPDAQRALSERLKAEEPVRTVERQPGAGVVIPPAGGIATPSAVASNLGAGERVAAAHMSVAAQRDSAAPSADNARVGAPAGAPALAQATVAAKAVDALQARVRPVSLPAGCYRVAAVSGGAALWGDAKLPFIIAIDSTGTLGRVLTTAGEDTQARAVVTRSDADSLAFRLRRVGFSGTLALGGVAPTRQGFARSLRATAEEQDVTVTARATACPP